MEEIYHMQRKVTKLENCHVQVDVVVDQESWKKAQDKAFNKLAQNVTVPGFRKGHAPLKLVKDRVDPMKVMDNAINDLLPGIYKEILTEEKLTPFDRPSVDVTKISDNELELKFIVVVAPEVELGAYKGLKVGKETVKVEDKDVDDAINSILKNSASLALKEGEAKLGDTVVMDFVGTIEGKPFDGGTANNYELELGSNTFIPGFEDQLVGVKSEEERDVNVTFPENYTPELKGKAATFHCTIHEIKEKKLPALDDEFVKEQKIPNVETVEAFKNHKKAELTAQKEKEAKGKYINALLEQIAKNSKIDVPEEAIVSQAESRKQELTEQMSKSNLSYEQYLTFVGQSDEEFTNNLKQQAKTSITNYLIIDEIAKKEDIAVSDADLEFEFAKLADQYHMSIDDVKKALSNQLDQFKDSVRNSRVEDLLFKEND